MFSTLPENFRTHGLSADIRTLLLLQKAIDKDLIRTLGDIFTVLKGVVVKDPQQIGPFIKAFYDYFLGIEIKPNESLNDAVLRSEVFKDWRENLEINENVETPDAEELVTKFLDEVHLTSYDIKKVLDGKEIFDKDNPDLEDNQADTPEGEAKRQLDKMADYSDLSLEELLERMKRVAEQQKTKHSGGSHWIGTGGISPYGHGGAAKNGVRVGGTGGGKMARAVLNDKNYFPVDLDKLVNDDNIDAALASLKGIVEESAQDKLDVKFTIKEGLKRGGLFIPEIRKVQQEKLQVILLIDNGGYSMSPYVKTIRQLFRKMKTRFAHDLETYYFHNTIYDNVYSDVHRTKPVKIEKLLNKDPNYRIFIMGDAAMAPYELTQSTLDVYKKLTDKFKKIAWLNPEPLHYWQSTLTINVLKELVPMYPMTPRGIENAVREMNKRVDI
ncbi:MAG: hypothetical protein ACI9V1_001124 [Spirosomataceae bacterium]|jgi:uncharacterized protein with von Willebrand factor type A (vWA) domain